MLVRIYPYKVKSDEIKPSFHSMCVINEPLVFIKEINDCFGKLFVHLEKQRRFCRP